MAVKSNSAAVVVIADATAEGSTIPMKTINDINLSAMATMTITEPIAGAADLFITEISADMGHYNYIEVFRPYDIGEA
mgnify:CR=1 FL=1